MFHLSQGISPSFHAAFVDHLLFARRGDLYQVLERERKIKILISKSGRSRERMIEVKDKMEVGVRNWGCEGKKIKTA